MVGHFVRLKKSCSSFPPQSRHACRACCCVCGLCGRPGAKPMCPAAAADERSSTCHSDQCRAPKVSLPLLRGRSHFSRGCHSLACLSGWFGRFSPFVVPSHLAGLGTMTAAVPFSGNFTLQDLSNCAGLSRHLYPHAPCAKSSRPGA